MRVLALSCVLLCACGQEVSSTPRIISIEPEEVLSGWRSQLRVELDEVPPFQFDYRRGTLQLPSEVALRVGEQPAALEGLEADGRLRFSVLALAGEEIQPVAVELPGGVQAKHAGGLRVVASLLPPEVEQPEGAELTGLSFDPIADQVRDVPFEITLRVHGPGAAGYQGKVQLTSSKGRVTPTLSGSFSEGVRVERLSLDKQSGSLYLTAYLGGLSVRSNTFHVAAR